jgi:hypothetical protein
MPNQSRNVQKLDIYPLDAIRAALQQGANRLRISKWSVRFDFWRGSFSAEETVATVEPSDDRK